MSKDLFAPPTAIELALRERKKYDYAKYKEFFTGVELAVLVGANDDYGNNSREIIFKLVGDCGFQWNKIEILGDGDDAQGIKLNFHGEFELEAFIKGLEFAVKTLKAQQVRKNDK